MRLRVSFIAVACVVAGCYQHHGATRDAGPDAGERDAGPLDAGPRDGGDDCEPLRAESRALVCPAEVFVGEPAIVGIEVTHGGCCSSGTLTARVEQTGPHIRTIAADASVCGCCASCECVGPTLGAELGLRGLPLGTATVRFGTEECSFEVVEAPLCRPLGVDAIRAPAVLFDEATFGFVTHTASVSCSCRPELATGSDGFHARLCDCCDACDCIDPPYELAYYGALPGDEVVIDGVTVHALERRAASACPEVEARLAVSGPSSHVRRAGPELWWLRMEGVSQYADCCGPSSGIELLSAGPSAWTARLRDCTPPCRCAGPPARLEAWMPLGSLEPGDYVIRAGAGEARFTVAP